MKQLYGNPDELIEVNDTQETPAEMGGTLKCSPQSTDESIQEKAGDEATFQNLPIKWVASED